MKNYITSCLALAFLLSLAACGDPAPAASFVGTWTGTGTTDITCPTLGSDAVNNGAEHVTVTDDGDGTYTRAVGPFGSAGRPCLIPLDARGKLVRIIACDVQGDGLQTVTITSWTFADAGPTATETAIGTFEDGTAAPPTECVFSFKSTLSRAP